MRPLANMRVLVALREADDVAAYVTVLCSAGADARVVGKRAAGATFAAGQWAPHVVVTDLVTQLVPKVLAPIRIIVLALAPEHESVLALGYDVVISKPVPIERLLVDPESFISAVKRWAPS